MWWLSHYLLGSCLQLLGVNLAIDAYGVPYLCNQGSWTCTPSGCVPSSTCGTTTMIGGPIQWGTEDQCYLPLPFTDPYYDFLWCQSVEIAGQAGPIGVTTPCPGDPGIVANADTPYSLRLFWENWRCPEIDWGMWCDPINVCTAQDKINGDCTCTAAEQANNECTP